MKSFVAFLGLVFFALTWIATPVSIIWLIAKGQWWPLGVLALGLLSHFLISIALLPGMALVLPMAATIRRRPVLGVILGLPSLAYTALLITVWCVGALLFLMSRATPQTWVPLLILSFSLGTGPWNYMAAKEAQGGGGDGSALATLFMNVAFIVTMAYVFAAHPTTARPLWFIFGGIMLAEVVCAGLYALLMARQQAALAEVFGNTDDAGG